MAAAAGLAADPGVARPFVEKLWDSPVPSGHYRYYNGLLYMMGLLETGGRFRIYFPAPGK
jgi:oligosaccharide reducing-end xylanase